MQYCDIHTHRTTNHTDDLIILNQEPNNRDAICIDIPYQSIGIHPWHIHNTEEQVQIIRKSLSLSRFVAIGEAGLDKLFDTSMEEQLLIFKAQAYLAEEFNKPMIIHCVKAWDELIAVKKIINPQMPWVIHGFRGNAKLAAQLIGQGFWLSFGKYAKVEAIIEAWPQVFTETDDDDISIREIYGQISAALQIPINLVGIQLRENVIRFFLFEFRK